MENYDLNFKDWYLSVINAIFGERNNINITTFLQVFFGPALYCHEIQETIEKINRPLTEKQTADKFYNEISVGELSERLRSCRRGSTLNTINGIITSKLSAIIQSDTFDIWEEMRENCDDRDRLEKGKQANYYKKDFIFQHYIDYEKFYIDYIAVILQALQQIRLISGVDKIIENVNFALFKKKDYRLNTYSDNEFKNAAYCVWNLVLLRIDSQYMIDTENLSRLRNENDKNVRKDLNNYASLIEYYPVNTIERFGTLKALAAGGNLYAIQELYFMYLNDTVLYDISGKTKFVLKSNFQEAETLFKKLNGSGEDFLSAFFRHNGHCDKENFSISLLQKYKEEYHNYNEKQLKAMMEKLLKIYRNKSIPFNIELLWFIKTVFDEHDFLKKSFKTDQEMIQARLTSNPWISELMDSASADNGPELHELLFFLYQKDIFKGDKDLLSICHEFAHGDIEILEKYKQRSKEKQFECFEMQIQATENDIDTSEIDTRLELWKMVSSILLKAIKKEKAAK